MKNRSKELLEKRGSCLYEKRKNKEKSEVEQLFEKISATLGLLDELVRKVEKECFVYAVPSFNSKIEVARRIDALKYEIALTLTKSKGIMDYFSTHFRKSINHTLVESISVHFHYKIDSIIKRMNDSLHKIEGIREKGEGDEAGVESVYKSIYYINRVITELKSVVISQSDKIDRLDVAMDYVANSANKSVGEIANISLYGSHVKNKIISVLFCSIVVLVVLSTIKAYVHSAGKAR